MTSAVNGTAHVEEPSLGNSSVVSALFWSALPLTLAACALSAAGVVAHLRQFAQPAKQRYVVRILFMVPVYTVVSQVGIGFPWAARYLELLRDCYEAVVIYAFFMLLVEFIGGEDEVPRVFNARRLPEPGAEAELDDPVGRPVRREGENEDDDDDAPPPISLDSRKSADARDAQAAKPRRHRWLVTLGRLLFFWRPENPDEDPKQLFLSIKRGILQFVVLMPVISIATVLSDLFQVFEDGDFSPEQSYVWLSTAHIISVTVAVIYLIRFYNIASHELKPYRPLPKFLCIKAVVFLSFYQNIVLAVVFAYIDTESLEYTAATLQNFMICVEMSLAAVAHLFYFSPAEYQFDRLQEVDEEEDDDQGDDGEEYQPRRRRRAGSGPFAARLTMFQALLASFLCLDIYNDTVRTFGPRGQLVEPLMAADGDDDAVVWRDESVHGKGEAAGDAAEDDARMVTV